MIYDAYPYFFIISSFIQQLQLENILRSMYAFSGDFKNAGSIILCNSLNNLSFQSNIFLLSIPWNVPTWSLNIANRLLLDAFC